MKQQAVITIGWDDFAIELTDLKEVEILKRLKPLRPSWNWRNELPELDSTKKGVSKILLVDRIIEDTRTQEPEEEPKPETIEFECVEVETA